MFIPCSQRERLPQLDVVFPSTTGLRRNIEVAGRIRLSPHGQSAVTWGLALFRYLGQSSFQRPERGRSFSKADLISASNYMPAIPPGLPPSTTISCFWKQVRQKAPVKISAHLISQRHTLPLPSSPSQGSATSSGSDSTRG